ncbi:MAG TPA: hypothetical protein VNT58_09905 [Gaiellaceae bacterium]|nr:hypothetical protein [Gaiellaceae bacterium]
MKSTKTLARLAALMLCSAVFAGTAFAGDKPKDDAPGSSGNAPGQVKKAEEQPAAAPQPQPAQQQPAPAAKQEAKSEKKAEKAEQKAAKATQPAAKPAQAPKPAKAAKPAKAKPVQSSPAPQAAKPAKASKPSKPVKAAKQSGSYKATSSGTDLDKGMSHKHTICHATGSSSNPYVRITPSISGVFNGHMGHQGGEDIIPPYTYKGTTYSQNWNATTQAIFNAGCVVPAAQTPATTTTQTTTGTTTTGTTTTQAACPPVTRTITEIVPGGVFHKTGSKTNPYVFIRPSKNSAHYDRSKHPDDIIVPDQTVTRTVEVAGNCQSVTPGQTTTVTLARQTVTLPGETVTIPGQTTTVAGAAVTIPAQTVTVGKAAKVKAPAGGVLGAQSPVKSQPERENGGGVLGATSRLGRSVAAAELPFTGMPVWVVALVGLGLLAAGLTLRRQS